MRYMHRLQTLLVHSCLAFAVLLVSAPGMGQWALLEGQAVDRDSGKLVYQERHSMAEDPSGLWVMDSDYLDPQGDLFAERTVWFEADSPQRPSYRLVDYRDDFEEGATKTEDGKFELYRIIDGERESAIIDPAKQRNLVIDAGFSALISDNWDALLQGERIRFDFASAARLTTIQFRLMHQPSASTDQAQRFCLEPSNWFVRMLVVPIELTYASSNKALIGYDGLSNIRRESGGNHVVSIAFPEDHQFTMRQLPSASRQAVP